MKQYLQLCQRIIDEGEWVHNARTGINCLTVINADLEYDVEHNVTVVDVSPGQRLFSLRDDGHRMAV